MLARFLIRAMDAQAVWTKPLGDLAHRFLHWLFHQMPAVRDLLNGRWLGHPLHAVLTDAPIGILFLVIVFDVIGQPAAAVVGARRRHPGDARRGAGGVRGLRRHGRRARERATLHSTLMIVALVVLPDLVRAAPGSGAPLDPVPAAAAGCRWRAS